ncbi:MAG: hypothetical protein NTW96_00690 [Planctomycetia bacterium]|nr:hypothetical protein [Planctomycetia bacterium]
MDQQTYDRMPKSIELREVLVQVDQPGCRTKSLVVVTTLCDAGEYPAEDIAQLYRDRWLAELNIRVVKTTVDMPRCKTPEMVRRKPRTHLKNLAGHRVGHRPDRVEPRAVERRPKPHPLLTKPRAEARLDPLAGAST